MKRFLTFLGMLLLFSSIAWAQCTPGSSTSAQQTILWDIPDTTGTTGLVLTEYVVEQQQDSGSFAIIAHVAAGTTTLVISGLAPSHTYTWRVAAVWNTGQSTYGLNGSPPPCVTITPTVNHLFVSVQPSNSPSNTVLPNWTVQVLNTNNQVVTNYNGATSIALGANPGSALLTGTVSDTFSNGVKTWCCDLRINKIGVGYNFIITAPGLPSIASGNFTVTGTAPGAPTNVAATPTP